MNREEMREKIAKAIWDVSEKQNGKYEVWEDTSSFWKQLYYEYADAILALLPDREEEREKFRRLLWLHHGCSINELYGDDGEMQCHACLIDFKRLPVDEIESIWAEQGFRRMMKYFEEALKPLPEP
jgi:hypothetical protein